MRQRRTGKRSGRNEGKEKDNTRKMEGVDSPLTNLPIQDNRGEH